MVHPRLAIASGFAALAAAILMLTGQLDAPIPLVVALLLAARAASPASTDGGAQALSRLGATVPAWTGIAVVGVLRAGSVSLADARGANAVAGVALIRGNPVFVAASWVALIAVIVTCVACTPSEGSQRVELVAVGAQIVFAVTLFAGPQIRRPTDAVPWILATMGMIVAMRTGRVFARHAWVPKAATAGAVVAVVLALAAPKL